jgi:hypothetical protein
MSEVNDSATIELPSSPHPRPSIIRILYRAFITNPYFECLAFKREDLSSGNTKATTLPKTKTFDRENRYFLRTNVPTCLVQKALSVLWLLLTCQEGQSLVELVHIVIPSSTNRGHLGKSKHLLPQRRNQLSFYINLKLVDRFRLSSLVRKEI